MKWAVETHHWVDFDASALNFLLSCEFSSLSFILKENSKILSESTLYFK